MGNNKKIGKALVSFTQVGLTVISPIIACLIIGRALTTHFGCPNYVLVISIVIGAVSGFISMIKFLLKVTK